MERRDYDYKKHDKLVITTKKALLEQVLNAYSVFKWEQLKLKDDKNYGDEVHVTLVRPHQLKNKDSVQYLQVCFEKYLDQISNAYTYKNLKSTLITSLVAVCGLAFVIGGLVLILNCANFLLAFGYFLAAIGLIIPVALIPLFIKTYRKENLLYKQKRNNLNIKIDEILKKARELLR